MSSIKLKWLIVLFALAAPLLHSTRGYCAQQRNVELIAMIGKDEVMGTFNEPAALFYDESKQRLYVADTVNNRLVSFDQGFTFLASLVHENFALPMGIVKLSTGEFFITDGEKAKVIFIDVKNKIIEPLNIRNVPPAAERFLAGRIAIGGDEHLYVIDRLNKRILVVDRNGNFLRSITARGREFYGFNDVRVDDRGFVYAVDTLAAKVYVFNDKGRLVSKFGGDGRLVFPVSVAVDSRGYVYVLDRHPGVIRIFDKTGRLQYDLLKKGYNPGELYNPSYIYIDAKDRIFTIDGNRVQVFKEKR